jgi:hypothetical protein
MNNDTRIKELLQKVDQQRKALGEKPKAAWRTNGIFKYREGQHININTVSDKLILVDALASLLETDASRKTAADVLGVSFKESLYNGYTVSEYVEDFKLRCSILDWEIKKKLLLQTEDKLNSLVSEEAKTEMALDDISKILG